MNVLNVGTRVFSEIWPSRLNLTSFYQILMFKLALAAGLVVATPEESCYFYAVPAAAMLDIKAQVNIKSASTLEFSVFFDVPAMGLEKEALVCEDEPYTWNASTSTMQVGVPLSTCLAKLLSMAPEGVMSTPIDLIYTGSALTTSIVIPVSLEKTATCETFGPGTPYSVSAATPAPSSESSGSPQSAVADTTTKSAAVLAVSMALAAILVF